jgi:hypothetical protein
MKETHPFVGPAAVESRPERPGRECTDQSGSDA